MFGAWLLNLGRTAAAAVLNTGAGVQAQQIGSGSGTTGVPGSIVSSGFYWAFAIPHGPTTFEMFSNGTATDFNSWWTPTTSGKGEFYWAELVALSGTGTMSGSALSTRIRIDTVPSWTLETTFRIRTFTLNIYNAASGGSLVATGTVELDTTFETEGDG